MKAYTLLSTDHDARRGVLHTAHGDVQTPFFMPIATVGAIKAGILPTEIRAMGFELILSNTYHLHLRPGEDRVKAFGGLGHFMGWDGPILTDSGGFQAFSLAKINQIDESGVHFRSHLDGSAQSLTPESVIQIQDHLGIDIAMQLDECTPYPCAAAEARESMERSLRWASRCKEEWLRRGAAERLHLFGINQGSFDPAMRVESAKALVDLDLPGYAVGGVVVAFDRTPEVLEATLPHLPTDKPRYLMGIGTPLDILDAVERGIDMFDCVLPTRNGRHGKAFTSCGEINLTAATWKDSDLPIDPDCDCPVCASYSRGYLRHLFQVNEILGMRLATHHNLHFYSNLMKGIRTAIGEERFSVFRSDFIEAYQSKEAAPI